MSEQDYLDVVKKLPTPTEEQIENFTQYVSTAHSWYKHLPIKFPGVPFIFYLDPGAGQNIVSDMKTQTLQLEKITKKTPKYHYNMRTTQFYLKEFGHWNYYAPYGSMVGVLSAERFTTNRTQLEVVSPQGQWINVPAELTKKGTAMVNSLLHPRHDFFIARSSAFIQAELENEMREKLKIPSDIDDLMKKVVLNKGKHDPVDKKKIDVLKEELNKLLEQERVKQLKGMKEVMLRFLEACGIREENL